MTIVLMYISRQTVPEYAIKAVGSKNKMYSCVRKLENKILQHIFQAK